MNEKISRPEFGALQKREEKRREEKRREEIIQKLPETLTEMESMVETSRRFTAYEIEVRAISKLGISFSEWLQLQPSESKEGEKGLMYIIPKESLSLS